MIDHGRHHPDVYYGSAEWSEAQVLHVAAAYSNPKRWQTRRRLFNDFRRHISAAANVRLHVGELAYGDRPFEVTAAGHRTDHQWRTRDELWHKENILNQVVSRFPADWQYGAYLDGDFIMTRPDWALEAIHLLQHFDWVQLFSSYTDLSADHQPLSIHAGFAYNWVEQGNRGSTRYQDGSPGGGWAFRRSAFEACGGLLDVGIVGAADHYMARGVAGIALPVHKEIVHGTPEYRRAIATWQARAASLGGNISYLSNHALHQWHGSKSARGYNYRWKILRDFAFDPYTDLYRDWQGIYQLTPAKPGLRDALRRYFASRNEDDPTLAAHERPLV